MVNGEELIDHNVDVFVYLVPEGTVRNTEFHCQGIIIFVLNKRL